VSLINHSCDDVHYSLDDLLVKLMHRKKVLRCRFFNVTEKSSLLFKRSVMLVKLILYRVAIFLHPVFSTCKFKFLAKFEHAI